MVAQPCTAATPVVPFVGCDSFSLHVFNPLINDDDKFLSGRLPSVEPHQLCVLGVAHHAL